MTGERADLSAPRRTRWLVAMLVLMIHVSAILGLIHAFAPGFTAKVAESVVSTFTVTVVTPSPTPSPTLRAPEKAGAAAEMGKKAVPKVAAAPKARIPIATEAAPPVAAQGAANTSGAGDSGQGSGAGGQGNGTGAGGSGSGQGGGIAIKPSVRSGELNDSRDFPVPEGGRQTRFGKSVTVVFTVTTDGRARDCSVARTSVDADTTARVCPLVIQKVRFNPATRADGTPVEARYGYRVDFKAR
ncbi:MAG: energy transducer TonB [Novosphingobium sp.]